MKELNSRLKKSNNINELKGNLYDLIVKGHDLESDVIEEAYTRIKEIDSDFRLWWEDNPQFYRCVADITSDKGYQNILLICGSIISDSKDNNEFVIPIDENNLNLFVNLIKRWIDVKCTIHNHKA